MHIYDKTYTGGQGFDSLIVQLFALGGNWVILQDMRVAFLPFRFPHFLVLVFLEELQTPDIVVFNCLFLVLLDTQ